MAAGDIRDLAAVQVATDLLAQIGAKAATITGAVASAQQAQSAAAAAESKIANIVDKISDQTIGGAKTFSESPLLPTPVAGDASQAAAPTVYVQSELNARQMKPTAKAATAAALPAYTYANGVITASANGALVIDGVTGFATDGADIVLIKDEASAQQVQGLYLVTNPGSASAPFVMTRHPSMTTASQVSGAIVPVGYGGATNENTLWLTNPTAGAPVVIGTSAIPFNSVGDGRYVSITGARGLTTVGQGLMKMGPNGLVAATSGSDYAAPIVRTEVDDANYTVRPTDTLVAIVDLTASRVITLPPAAAYNSGIALMIVDESGSASPMTSITITCAGTDVIVTGGAGASIDIQTAGQKLTFHSNGVSKWTYA